MKERFNNDDMRQLARSTLAERKQTQRESVNEYAEAVEKLARKGYTPERVNESEGARSLSIYKNS